LKAAKDIFNTIECPLLSRLSIQLGQLAWWGRDKLIEHGTEDELYISGQIVEHV